MDYMVTEKSRNTGLFEPVRKGELKQDVERQAHSTGVFLAVQSYFKRNRTKKAGKGVIAR